MAQFAIFYNTSDMTVLASAFTTANLNKLTAAQKLTGLALWNGGLKNWQSAPQASLVRQEGDPGTKQIVVNATGLGLADLITLLNAAAVTLVIPYLGALAGDMGRASGGQEPWP